MWVLSTLPPLLSGTPWRSSMQMLIRNWCIAGGFKVMTSQGGSFTIKYSNPYWQCSLCSTTFLEMHLWAKFVYCITEINYWDEQSNMWGTYWSGFWILVLWFIVSWKCTCVVLKRHARKFVFPEYKCFFQEMTSLFLSEDRIWIWTQSV